MLMFNGLITISCKSNSKSSTIKRLDNELSSVSRNCYRLHIVEQLPVIDPQTLKPPKIEVESVPILNDDGAHTGNNEVKISVSYEQSDSDGFDMPDVIYYRFCNKKTASQTECLSAKKGERLILDDRNDGIISNYQNVAFNPGLSERQVFDVYAWSCVWHERASKVGESVVVRYPSQFSNRMLVCQKQHGQASSPYYQDKNVNKNLRSLMVDNFDNEAGMKGLAYLSLTRFDRYLQETKSAKLSFEEQKIALQLENNLALGEHYGLFLTSNFELISSEVDKKSANLVADSEKKGFQLSADEDDCSSDVEEELNDPITKSEDTYEGVVQQPPAAPSGGLGTLEYPEEDIGKQEIVDCERRGPEFEFKEGKCWHKQDDKVISAPAQEVEETPIDQESEESSGSLAANLGGWTLIFAGTVAGLASAVGLSQGIKASRVSSASIVDPFFRTPPSVAGLSAESQGTGKPQTVTLPASGPGSNLSFSQRYSELKQKISNKVHQAGVSSLQKLGAPKNLGGSSELSKTASNELKYAGRKLILGSVGTGLMGAAMFTLGVVTNKGGLNLEAETEKNSKQKSFLKLHDDLNLFFQNFSEFTQRHKVNARKIEEILK